MHIGIIDLVTNSSKASFWGRMMHGNYAGVMPQSIAVWCEDQGHEVTYVCYACEKSLSECVKDFDLAFIGSFTQSAQLAYALGSLLKSRGAVTAMGGPHALSFPEDAVKYFDYVLGLTNKEIIKQVLEDCSPHRPTGIFISAEKQPDSLPGVRQRWKYIQKALKKSPLIKIVPMLSSLGCPYTCDFCCDARIPYQPLDLETIKEDLKFLLSKVKRPIVGWSDPNFGVQFNKIITAIEEAVPPNRIAFYGESSLALLSKTNVKRLKKNGFKVLLPGVESWFQMGNKSKTGAKTGMDKVLQLSDQVNMILSHIPYMQINFLFPLDVDEGPEPFELTKRFADLAPGAFPHYSLITAYGRSAPYNSQYQKENRAVPVPFHVLDAQMGMNVKPKNYSWPEFINYLINLAEHTFSKRAIFNRFKANKSWWSWLNVIRGITTQGIGRTKRLQRFLDMYNTDPQFRAFQEGDTTEVPRYYVNWIKRDLGVLSDWLPEGALIYDPNTYLKTPDDNCGNL
jgi:hypothetical protein